MARLRAPGTGCPWDLAQTFATIAPYTIEEAYEVADAIERGALDDLCGELGDLLFQVTFHARMAEEAGAFDFGDVVAGICEKLERRHPHVFGERRDLGVAEQSRLWEEIKRDERERRRAGGDAVAGSHGPYGVASARRRAGHSARPEPRREARQAGRDGGLRLARRRGRSREVGEELDEVDAALAGADRAAVAAEIGDLLFTVANLCRHLELDPEACVRGANARFEKRFEHVERRVAAEGGDWSAHDPAELDRFWREAKSATSS